MMNRPEVDMNKQMSNHAAFILGIMFGVWFFGASYCLLIADNTGITNIDDCIPDDKGSTAMMTIDDNGRLLCEIHQNVKSPTAEQTPPIMFFNVK